VLAVTNGGGLRKSVMAEGDLSKRDIFELLPFENALVALDLTGAQVLDLLRVAVFPPRCSVRSAYQVSNRERQHA